MFATFRPRGVRLGDLGAGQLGKSMNNYLLWVNTCANDDVARLAEATDLDWETGRSALLRGSGGNEALRGWHRPRRTPWAEKDLAIATELAAEAHVDLTLVAVATAVRALNSAVVCRFRCPPWTREQWNERLTDDRHHRLRPLPRLPVRRGARRGHRPHLAHPRPPPDPRPDSPRTANGSVGTLVRQVRGAGVAAVRGGYRTPGCGPWLRTAGMAPAAAPAGHCAEPPPSERSATTATMVVTEVVARAVVEATTLAPVAVVGIGVGFGIHSGGGSFRG